MPKLIVSMDGLVLNEFDLTQGRVKLGRAASNDIRLDNRAVSSEHLRIFWDGTRSYVVEDLDSTNGTTLNGQRITKRHLVNNDVIGVGKYCIKFVMDEDFDQNKLTAQGMTFEKTSVEEVIAAKKKEQAQRKRREKKEEKKKNGISFTTTLPRSIYQTRTSLTQTSLSDSSVPFTNTDFEGHKDSPHTIDALESEKEETPLPQARVRLIHGEIIGKEVPIDGKKPVRIGRAGHVARIILDNGAWFLMREQGGIPAINGVAIDLQHPHPLKHGDHICVGGLLLQFLNDWWNLNSFAVILKTPRLAIRARAFWLALAMIALF